MTPLPMVLVLLSALVKRFSVSRIRDLKKLLASIKERRSARWQPSPPE